MTPIRPFPVARRDSQTHLNAESGLYSEHAQPGRAVDIVRIDFSERRPYSVTSVLGSVHSLADQCHQLTTLTTTAVSVSWSATLVTTTMSCSPHDLSDNAITISVSPKSHTCRAYWPIYQRYNSDYSQHVHVYPRHRRTSFISPTYWNTGDVTHVSVSVTKLSYLWWHTCQCHQSAVLVMTYMSVSPIYSIEGNNVSSVTQLQHWWWHTCLSPYYSIDGDTPVSVTKL